MSWSFSIGPVDIDTFDKSFSDARRSLSPSPEQDEQIDEAFSVASKILESGVVGDYSEKKFYISVSGHANAGHVGNDCMSIYISQATG